MKKTLSLVLVVLMVLTLAVACNRGSGSSSSSSSASTGTAAASSSSASSTPSGDLVLYSSMTDADIEALVTCFNEVYPNINIEVVNGSAGDMITRLRGEASNPVGDVTWGGMNISDGTAYADVFEAWVTENDAENPPAYRSNNGLYSMDHLSTVIFCVNTELEAELGLNIRTYEDLLNPALKGKIIFSDPNSSSAAWNNVCNIMSVYGPDSDAAWDYIEKLMPNLVITNSSSTCFRSVYQGEYVVGLTYEDGAVNLVKDGATNLRLQYPENGTSANVHGMGLVKNGPNPENAKLLIDFATSAEGQTALAAYQQGTLRYTNASYQVPENAWLPATDEIKWVDRDVDYLTSNKAQILEHWNDIWARIH